MPPHGRSRDQTQVVRLTHEAIFPASLVSRVSGFGIGPHGVVQAVFKLTVLLPELPAC